MTTNASKTKLITLNRITSTIGYHYSLDDKPLGHCKSVQRRSIGYLDQRESLTGIRTFTGYINWWLEKKLQMLFFSIRFSTHYGSLQSSQRAKYVCLPSARISVQAGLLKKTTYSSALPENFSAGQRSVLWSSFLLRSTESSDTCWL